MNWAELETTLYASTAALLRRFARDHTRERFYGFIFDVNADYGEVLLCLNTESGLSDWAAKQYPHYSQAEVDQKLRWNAGDWQYQGFNLESPYATEWEGAWSKIQDAIQDACLDDEEGEVSELFLQAVCRVVFRLEASADFSVLNRETYFATLVSDHDEDLQDSRARMELVRGESAV